MHLYDIKISSPKDLNKRAFISVTINGVRHREYNGNRLDLNIRPNKAKSIKERSYLLRQLEYEFRKSLENGEYQKLVNGNQEENRKTGDLLNMALKQKLQSNLSRKYAKALKTTCEDFLSFLTEKELSSDVRLLGKTRIQEYLNKFRATPTYYMSKRRELSSLFGYLKNNGGLKLNLAHGTDKIKTKASLHKTYSQKQLGDVLSYLKYHHENLYLCCLISYGCFLRPHIEVRNLKGGHFKSDYTEIHLSGDENKSGRVRAVYVPDYVKEAIAERVERLGYEDNLFSMSQAPYNEYYFKTAWSRHFKTMLGLGLVEQNQTIYSFRHTAAVNVYKQTKDLHLLQQLLGHSNMIVTLKYLRGLGVHNMEELKGVMPVL